MSNLFSSIEIKSLTLRNRVVVSPMQQYSSKDGFANDWHLVHYGSRAIGGAGLVITESAIVDPDGRSTASDLGIWKDEHIDYLKKITDFVHHNHSKIAIQLAHFGSKGSKSHPNDGFQPITIEQGGWQTVSSSEKAPFPGMSTPQKMTIKEIKDVQKNFVEAAKRSVIAGFDAIELHAAHGYLFHQFYSELINDRTDAYGGSFENRIRFLVETIEAIRKIIPDTMPLFVKISAVDYLEKEKAWKIEDSIKLVQQLKSTGVDVVTVSGGGFAGPGKSKVMEGYQLPFAEKIKDASKMITATVGGIRTAEFANQVIENEQADLVVIAREHLRNPYFTLGASQKLNSEIDIPWQYKRGFHS